jgi:hypothetical protein
MNVSRGSNYDTLNLKAHRVKKGFLIGCDCCSHPFSQKRLHTLGGPIYEPMKEYLSFHFLCVPSTAVPYANLVKHFCGRYILEESALVRKE